MLVQNPSLNYMHLTPLCCRDEILGTTLKDFREFGEVLAAVRDKGQVVAVTSGRWIHDGPQFF